ncbi:unnamed protein product [Phytophthora fragariaefolia]|uniref:Unnamed protein product n=1 Tax=Phytophthora fragariaefolia TaxID=1490495 RepID=A0A9W6Y3Z9_9STRA|nr:unnamed protein product [Phytophthora fragariaefolia]
MSPDHGPDDILKDGNHFHWEFNARKALAVKDLLLHVTLKSDEVTPGVDRESASWKTADLNAFAILARLLSPVYQAMARDATSARHVWETLEAFFVRRSLHNPIQLRRQLHEFRMASGSDLLEHLLQFDTMCMNITAVGDQLAEDGKMVILLGILSSDYDSMTKVALNAGRSSRHKQHHGQSRGRSFQGSSNRDGTRNHRHGRFPGRCFKCKKSGHKQAECPESSGRPATGAGEFVFSVLLEHTDDWLLDSGAISHMTFCKLDFIKYRHLTTLFTIGIANGQAMEAKCVGDVRLVLSNDVQVNMVDVLFVPFLDRCLISSNEEVCSGCMKEKLPVAKISRAAKTTVKSQYVLALVHSDVMGPVNMKSTGGARYVLIFIDDFSRFTVVYFLKNKSEVLEKFVQYKVFAEKQFDHSIRYDRAIFGATEWSVRANEQNYHGDGAFYDLRMWTNSLGGKLDIRNLRVFGARGFGYIDKTKRKKLDAKAYECIFLGYADAAKAYRVWNVDGGNLVTSRSVRFDESDATRYIQVMAGNKNKRHSGVDTFVDDDDQLDTAPRPAVPSPEPIATDEDMLETSGDHGQMGVEVAANLPLPSAAFKQREFARKFDRSASNRANTQLRKRMAKHTTAS